MTLLEFLMKERGISQSEMAAQVDMHQEELSRFFYGDGYLSKNRRRRLSEWWQERESRLFAEVDNYAQAI